MRAGIHVNNGAGEHAELANPEVGAHLHARQTHHQIDDEEGESRHQTQGEQVERAFLFNAGVDRLEAVAKLGLDAVTQQKAGDQEGQRGADGRRKADQHGAPEQAENRPANQGQQSGAGEGEGGDRDIDDEENGGSQQRLLGAIGFNGSLLRLEEVEAEVLPEAEEVIGGDQGNDQPEQSEFFAVHAVAALAAVASSAPPQLLPCPAVQP